MCVCACYLMNHWLEYCQICLSIVEAGSEEIRVWWPWSNFQGHYQIDSFGGSGARLNDGPDIKLFILVGWGRSFFVRCLAHRGSTVGFLLLQQCFSGLLDTPGISRCRSQHVSVESSSLFHHSIYLWFTRFPWWSFDELENLHADRTTVCFEPWQKPRVKLGIRKTGLSPPPPPPVIIAREFPCQNMDFLLSRVFYSRLKYGCEYRATQLFMQ